MHMHDGSAAVNHMLHIIVCSYRGVTDGVIGLHSSDEILFLPNEELVSQFSHTKNLVDHDNILILSPNNTWLPSYPHKSTFENYYIIVHLKKMLIFCWQLVHVARSAGISKDFILFVILEYYLINYVKFSAIYVLTTSPLVSDNRVLVWKIDGE